MMNYDPFKILEVNYTTTLPEIREAFKQKALIHHPDRGGNPYVFDLCKKAYHDIYIYKQQQIQQLNKEKRNITTLKQERTSSYAKQLNKSQQKQLFSNFNKIFQNTKIETPNDIGYGNFMVKSEQKYENNPQSLSLKKKFDNKQLIIYEEPQPLPSLNQNYEELGQNKIKDFSNKSLNGLQYTDYMVAHTEQEVCDKPHERIARLDNVKNKPQYKTVEQLVSDRSNISYDMSPEEQAKYNRKKQMELELEEKRKMQFFQYKQNIQKKFDQIHNYLSY